ncbi:hypothetical protein NHG35_03115 [Aerococcaceae bacterium NML180378]|nr:hypothetical protein [Aerococcaceae bacterium NML180378]
MLLKKLLLSVGIGVLLLSSNMVAAESAIPVEERIIHQPIFPKSYSDDRKPPKFTHPKGEKLGYEPNTLHLKEHAFPFVDMRPKKASDEVDFTHLMTNLDANHVVAVGKNNIQTFFGHYYDLTGTGVFNPIVDENLIEVGSIAIVTDEDGYSKGYEFTQILEVQHAEQDYHYYDKTPLPKLAYNGNGTEMLFVQYCRWDISYGLLIGNVGYRVW